MIYFAFLAITERDSGAVSSDRHGMLLLGMLGGLVIAGAAGIPAGLAFFRSGNRKRLLIVFGVLVAAGVGIQAWAWWTFFNAAS